MYSISLVDIEKCEGEIYFNILHYERYYYDTALLTIGFKHGQLYLDFLFIRGLVMLIKGY